MGYQIQIILQLLLAIFLGGMIGLERERKKKVAGLQTYTLVVLGSCIFAILGCEAFNIFSGNPGADINPTQIILAVATGIGFIGAGVVLHRDDHHVEGITTAAGLWTAAAIGVAVGFKLYLLAFFATLLIIFILIVFGEVEKIFFSK